MNEMQKTINREMNFSGLTIIFVGLGPYSFIQLQQLQVPMWISFTVFFICGIVGIFFQSLRRKETGKLRELESKKVFQFQIGDEVQYQGSESFVVLKHGFNHYYLRDLKKDRIILVKRSKLEYNNEHGLQVRPRENFSERSF